jgi:hypothetical protein
MARDSKHACDWDSLKPKDGAHTGAQARELTVRVWKSFRQFRYCNGIAALHAAQKPQRDRAGRNRLVKHFIAGLGSVGRPDLRG